MNRTELRILDKANVATEHVAIVAAIHFRRHNAVAIPVVVIFVYSAIDSVAVPFFLHSYI